MLIVDYNRKIRTKYNQKERRKKNTAFIIGYKAFFKTYCNKTSHYSDDKNPNK